YSYAVAVNGGEITLLAGDTYTVTASGEATFVFYLLDGSGNLMDTSKIYHVLLDFSQTAVDSEAWMMLNGEKVYGTLSSLLQQAEAGATIYLLTSDVITLGDASMLNAVTLKPDEDAFGSGHCVIISTNDPDGE
ncbi:MAG: hypothetical protein LLF96_04100, partial [Eubacteriales bacterium]|nr:hypothetical protein [Eubacteriales bacterium]